MISDYPNYVYIVQCSQLALQVLIIVLSLIFNYDCIQVLVNNNLFTQRSS